MKSRIYVGRVRHRRFRPAAHSFSYAMAMLYLDLDELPQLFEPFHLWSSSRPALARFAREDHLGNRHIPLKSAVQSLVQDRAGIQLTGPIRILTGFRFLGFGFSPVCFYYCFNERDTAVEAIVAEVNNTPWGEQYCYVLPANSGDGADKRRTCFDLEKSFHVSPFMELDLDYHWRFSTPGHHLGIYMRNLQQGSRLFDASLSLKARPLTAPNLANLLIRYPFMGARILLSIYYQALRLWIKKVPFFPHPDRHTTETTERQT